MTRTDVLLRWHTLVGPAEVTACHNVCVLQYLQTIHWTNLRGKESSKARIKLLKALTHPVKRHLDQSTDKLVFLTKVVIEPSVWTKWHLLLWDVVQSIMEATRPLVCVILDPVVVVTFFFFPSFVEKKGPCRQYFHNFIKVFLSFE